MITHFPKMLLPHHQNEHLFHQGIHKRINGAILELEYSPPHLKHEEQKFKDYYRKQTKK